MKDSLYSENSFIFDRSWEKVNPEHQLKVTTAQAKEFIFLLVNQHQNLRSYSHTSLDDLDRNTLKSKIHSFILKYIQQKQLGSLKKGEIPFVREADYMFDLGDCLQIWRWINEDINSSRVIQTHSDEYTDINEFTLGKTLETTQLKRPNFSNMSKRLFKELSLQQQQSIMKKSLEMVYMYKHQLKIIFKHYSRFSIQNQHKRTDTFDQVAPSLQVLTVNRFMLFCRDFDIIKIVQFKRKTEHNYAINKQILLTIFKKTAYLQKYLSFQGFMLSLVSIAIKIHENIDPRSLMHVELLLNALHIRYHHEFSAKLDLLSIRYTPDDFYHCYKDILKKANKKIKKDGKITLFSNPHFMTSEAASSRYKQSVNFQHRQQQIHQSDAKKVIKYQSVPHLMGKRVSPIKVRSQNLQKRKTSLPILPSIDRNKFFKPIQHNHHKNIYKKYLKQSEETSSVFKNRITGYSNINTLKHLKPFHMNDNPEIVSKDTLSQLITDTKTKIQIVKPVSDQHEGSRHQPTTISEVNESLVYSNITTNQQLVSQNNSLNFKLINQRSQVSRQTVSNQQQQVPTIYENGLLKRDENDKKKVIKQLSEKVSLDDNDSLLNKHLLAQSQRSKSEIEVHKS